MAERDYMRGEGVTPIQEMSTRQMRRYIRERAEEANARLNTLSVKQLEEAPEAFREQLDYIKSFGQGRSGAIKKDTSRMDKEEMAMYAYALRDLNMLDSFSRYARNQDYKQNKQRYEQFVKNQISGLNPNAREHWKQYVNESGSISKRGFQEYKDFINYIKSLDSAITTYGYEFIKDEYIEQDDKKKREEVEALLLESYEENKGKGLTPSQLLDDYYDRVEAKRKKENKKKKAAPKIPKVKTSKKKSGTNIKIKQGVKMKDGTVREKQTTKKL